jgi:hypothetical protein
MAGAEKATPSASAPTAAEIVVFFMMFLPRTMWPMA